MTAGRLSCDRWLYAQWGVFQVTDSWSDDSSESSDSCDSHIGWKLWHSNNSDCQVSLVVTVWKQWQSDISDCQVSVAVTVWNRWQSDFNYRQTVWEADSLGPSVSSFISGLRARKYLVSDSDSHCYWKFKASCKGNMKDIWKYFLCLNLSVFLDIWNFCLSWYMTVLSF